MPDDGLQDDAETYYLNKYLPDYRKRIDDSWNHYKEGERIGKALVKDLVGEIGNVSYTNLISASHPNITESDIYLLLNALADNY